MAKWSGCSNQWLADPLAEFGGLIRSGIAAATKPDDAHTEDLFTGVSRDVDKDLWILEAHLEGRH